MNRAVPKTHITYSKVNQRGFDVMGETYTQGVKHEFITSDFKFRVMTTATEHCFVAALILRSSVLQLQCLNI